MGTTITATDERRLGFFMIHNAVVDNFGLTPYEGWLYAIIARHVNQKTGVAFPSLTTLAAEGNMSRMQVTRCLKALEDKKLLKITRRPTKTGGRAVNHYRLLEPPTVEAKVVTDSDQDGENKANLVTDSDQGSNSQLLGVVTDSYPNNTNMNKTNEQDSAPVPKNGTGAARAQTPKPAEPKPKAPRPRDPIFDAIAECSFGIPIGAEVANDTGARIGKVKREVLTTFPALTAEQLRAAYGWHTNTENLTAPRDPAKVVTMVGVYQSKHPSRSGSAPTFTPRPDCKQCGGTGLVLPALGAYEDGDPRANTPIQCPVCVKAARASEAQREAVGL